MIGYYKVPLYSDNTATEVIKHLYIPIVSRENAEAYAQSVFQFTNYNNGTTSMSKGGIYSQQSWKYSLRFRSKGLSVNGDDSLGENLILPKTRDELITRYEELNTLFSSLLTPGAGSLEKSTEKFNLLSLFGDETKDYFFKNGAFIRVVISSSQPTIPKSVNIHFYNAGGTRVTGITDINYELVNASDSDYNSGNNYISISNIPSYRKTGNYYTLFGFFACIYIFDDLTGIKWNDLYSYDASRLLYGEGYTTVKAIQRGLSEIRTNRFPGTIQNFFSSVLGLGTGSASLTAFENASGAEYREDVPDDENTYPGGGDDKNTYPQDGESGKGTFDDTNDPIDFPSMPLWDATSTGFISMWNPTIAEITQLYSFLWDSDISTTLKKLFLEPMDAIISLAFFPVDPVNFPEKRNVTIGHVDTEITMYAVQKQFVDFDFGTIKLDEYYGAAWDYSPYTKVSIYLPYIGSQELDVDDVMNANLHLQYRIDLLSGMCAAMLKCTRDRDDLDAVIYTWQGNCAMQVPITAGSAREFINSIIQIGAMTGLALVQPAAGAINAVAHAGEEGYSNPSTAGQWVSPAMATYSALNVLGQKVHVQRGGRVDANAGVMSPQSAYLIIDRPISAIPKGWNEYAGYPSLKIKALSTQKGMTQVAYIKLNGLEATAEEISELDRILKAGVIL